MLARLRLIVILLLVTLPPQGLTTSARALCVHSHAAGSAMLSHADPIADASGRPHFHVADALAHDHALHARDDGATADGMAADTGGEPTAGSCAHCAECSVATALIGAVAELPELSPVHAEFLPGWVAFPFRPFDGPERPPRTA